MFFGWTGIDLEVDLGTGNVERSDADLDVCRAYLGGRSLGAKIAWDRISPETEPFSPENLLVFNTGALTGTTCPGANRAIVTTRSPQNNLQTYSSFGGFWGAELKFAGYDSLVVAGKSAIPVYIWIDDGRVEVRDARHLWGKDTFETQRIIRQDADCPDAQIVCIGPAGENRVYCASLEHGQGSSASRAGIGAVMGDKNLKAIAVRGTKAIQIARPSEFGPLCEQLLLLAQAEKARIDDVSHNQTAGLMRLSLWGNLESELRLKEIGDLHAQFLEAHRPRRPACFNCQIGCRQAVRLPGSSSFSYSKCVSPYCYLPAFKIESLDFNYRAYELVERLGMDTVSICALGPFAIELFEKGILTEADTDGLRLEFGNEEVALKLIEMIGRREGIGDVLADGVLGAARRIGRGAAQYAHHVKGLEPVAFPHQFAYIGFAAALADRPDVTRQVSYVPQHLLRATDDFKEEYMKSAFWPYPDEWKDLVRPAFDPTGGDWERMSKMLSRDRDEINLSDCTGVCTFWTDFAIWSPVKGWDQAALLSYATGMDMDEEEALWRASRGGALIRAYNAILGLRRKDDVAPEIFFRQPASPRFAPLDRTKFDRVVAEYYKLRGWNAEGIPTKEKLLELGLDFVAEELVSRGLYGEN